MDREVVGYTPYTNIKSSVTVGESLILIGHPTGLPKKTDKTGVVTGVSDDIIRGNTDSFGGNSGSPVFDANGNLIGILSGGDPADFTYDDSDGCAEINFCPGGPGCTTLGEYIVPICQMVTADSAVESQLNLNCGSNSNPTPTATPTPTSTPAPPPSQDQSPVSSDTNSFTPGTITGTISYTPLSSFSSFFPSSFSSSSSISNSNSSSSSIVVASISLLMFVLALM